MAKLAMLTLTIICLFFAFSHAFHDDNTYVNQPNPIADTPGPGPTTWSVPHADTEGGEEQHGIAPGPSETIYYSWKWMGPATGPASQFVFGDRFSRSEFFADSDLGEEEAEDSPEWTVAGFLVGSFRKFLNGL